MTIALAMHSPGRARNFSAENFSARDLHGLPANIEAWSPIAWEYYESHMERRDGRCRRDLDGLDTLGASRALSLGRAEGSSSSARSASS